jgi:HKD family nuclease
MNKTMVEQMQNRAQLIIQPFSRQSLGAILKAGLGGRILPFHTFRAAVAFVKRSGVQHIQAELNQFVQQGGLAQLVVGIDQLGSSQEGLAGLLSAVGETGSVWINRTTEMYITFHPKVYLFTSDAMALLVVGSGNLTEGGLYTNDEACLTYWLDLHKAEDAAFLQEMNVDLDRWCNTEDGNALLLTADLLNELVEAGLIPTEEKSVREGDEATHVAPVAAVSTQTSTASVSTFFKKSATKRAAPRFRTGVTRPKKPILHPEEPIPQQIEPTVETPIGFVMILQRTDVGTGQTTPGASPRSPEIFIPLAARDAFPEFWGWPTLFTEDAARPRKHDRVNVRMRIGGELIMVNMMTWPVKHDFRLRSESLRSAGTVGDILRLEKPAEGAAFDYYVEIIPQGTSNYEDYLVLCTNPVRNSEKRWGYYR